VWVDAVWIPSVIRVCIYGVSTATYGCIGQQNRLLLASRAVCYSIRLLSTALDLVAIVEPKTFGADPKCPAFLSVAKPPESSPGSSRLLR
jgi:hypothetical protein